MWPKIRPMRRLKMILMVIKKDGSREAFDRTDYERNYKSLRKRPVTLADMEKIVDDIEEVSII